VVFIGAEASMFGQNGTMNDYLKVLLSEIVDGAPTGMLPRAAVTENYSSMDSITYPVYQTLCGNNCLKNLGIPSVWLTQPSFQHYHGGLEVSSTDSLFSSSFKGPGQFPSTRYTSLDNRENFDRTTLLPMVTTISGLIINAANSDLTGQLVYNKPGDLTESDLKDIVKCLQIYQNVFTTVLPKSSQPAYDAMLEFVKQKLSSIISNPSALNQQEVQKQAQILAVSSGGIVISSDFFSAHYPGRQATQNQEFPAGYGQFEMPTLPPTPNGGMGL